MMRIWPMASLVLLLLLGCGVEDDAVVVTVGSGQIRADEFGHLFRKAAAADSSLLGDVAGRVRFAEKLGEDLLYEQAFYEREGEFDAVRADRIDDFAERRAVEYLRKVEYGDAQKVTDAELAQAYERQGTRRHLRRMVLESESKAIEVRRAVTEGALFDRVAMQISLDERSRELGGEIGWVTFVDLPALERDAVWATPVGEISEPIAGGAVIALYQVLEEDVNHSRGTLEEERPKLELGISQQKVIRAVASYKKILFEKAHFKMDPAQVAWMTVHLHEKTTSAVRGADVIDDPTTEERDGYLLTRGHIPWTGPPVLPADTSRVLATYDPDGEVQPVLVFDQLLTNPIPTWPTFEKSADVEKLIRELVLERLEQAEVYRRGYDKVPEVVFDVRERERDIARRQLVRNQLRTPSIPSDEEIRAEYDRRIDEFTTPEARRFVAVNTTTREAAARAEDMLRAGRPLAEIVGTFGPEENVQSTGDAGTPPITKGDSPALDDVIFALGMGEVSGPVPVGQTFTVAKVVDIIPGEIEPFEDVRTELQIKLVDRAIEPLEKDMIEEARKKYPVDIDVAVLRKLDLTS